MLKGGTPRTLGRVSEVVEVLKEDGGRFDELVNCLNSADRLVKLRAADALEKFCRKHPEKLNGYRDLFLANMDQWADEGYIMMSLPLLLRYISWQGNELWLVKDRLMKWLGTYPDKFVKVMCIQALADLAVQHVEIQEEVKYLVQQHLETGSASMKARCRKLWKKLGE